MSKIPYTLQLVGVVLIVRKTSLKLKMVAS